MRGIFVGAVWSILCGCGEPIATAKHLAVNSIEDTRFDVDVVVDERALREVYLPQFERLVKGARVGAVMSAYNQVNGAYASENTFLLHDVLKTEWGFPGPVMSDGHGPERAQRAQRPPGAHAPYYAAPWLGSPGLPRMRRGSSTSSRSR